MKLSWTFTYKDHEPYELCVGALPALACDNVPLLWRTHDDLRTLDLLLVQLMVPRQFIHRDPVRTEPLEEEETYVNLSTLGCPAQLCGNTRTSNI